MSSAPANFDMAVLFTEIKNPFVIYHKSHLFGLEIRCIVPEVIFALLHLISLCSDLDLFFFFF